MSFIALDVDPKGSLHLFSAVSMHSVFIKNKANIKYNNLPNFKFSTYVTEALKKYKIQIEQTSSSGKDILYTIHWFPGH